MCSHVLGDGARYCGCQAGTWYRDADGDGFGDPASFLTACDGPSGYVPVAGDCDDANPAVRPGATEICDGAADEDADGVDTDGDGVANTCDNCRFAANADQADTDGTGDACDNCPTIPSPNQDPCGCAICGTYEVTISFESPLGGGSGTVRWQTDIEVDLA